MVKTMAKTYLDIVKYMVEAKFAIDGMVDKPDIIGAVFGQTEGLLGDELDLRELQKSGKIGRIEIELAHGGNKCNGKLYLPASLDRIETCILAASIEAVDRVGPYEATFQVERVEDTRSEKRRKILSRAKELVKQLMDTGMPDSKELSEIVQSDVRISEITSYGPEHLPAGPEVGKSPELIIVEGRADVLTLLKSDITNGIAIGGASAAPKTIINLCREKEVTVFLDGDRGGDLILRNLVNVAEVDFVARAPDGKEVEDLTRKEIIKALRTKVPLDQYMGRARQPYREKKEHPQYEQQEQSTPQPRAEEEKLEQEEAEQPISHASSQDKRDDFGINDLDDAGQIEKIDSSRYAEPTEAVQQKPWSAYRYVKEQALRPHRQRAEGDADKGPSGYCAELKRSLCNSSGWCNNAEVSGTCAAEGHKGDIWPKGKPHAEKAHRHSTVYEGAGKR
jgi:DNA primase